MFPALFRGHGARPLDETALLFLIEGNHVPVTGKQRSMVKLSAAKHTLSSNSLQSTRNLDTTRIAGHLFGRATRNTHRPVSIVTTAWSANTSLIASLPATSTAVRLICTRSNRCRKRGLDRCRPRSPDSMNTCVTGWKQ